MITIILKHFNTAVVWVCPRGTCDGTLVTRVAVLGDVEENLRGGYKWDVTGGMHSK
jgi:hypothetical protein